MSAPPDRSLPAAPASPLARGAAFDLAGFAQVALAAAAWGTWSLFLRPTHLPATTTAPLLFLVMGLVTLPGALRSPPVHWDRGTLALVGCNAAFDALNVLSFFAAIQCTTIAIAVLTHYLAPVLIAIAAPRIDRVVTRGVGAAAVVALAGLVIILEPWHAPADGAVLGAALGLGSAICYAGNVFTVRRIATRIGATRALCYHALVAAAVMAPLAARGLGQATPGDLGLLAAGAAGLGAAGGVAFSLGLLRIGSARAAVLTFIEPVVAVAVGAAVWREPLHPVAAVGGALVLGAGIQVARKAR